MSSLPGSFNPASEAGPSKPLKLEPTLINDNENWESDDEHHVSAMMYPSSTTVEPTTPKRSAASMPASKSGRASPATSAASSSTVFATTTRRNVLVSPRPRQRTVHASPGRARIRQHQPQYEPQPPPQPRSQSQSNTQAHIRTQTQNPNQASYLSQFAQTLSSTLSLLLNTISIALRTLFILLTPIMPYILSALLFLLGLSTLSYLLRQYLPKLLFKLPGYILHLLLGPISLPSFSSLSGLDKDIALGQSISLLPLRTLATPTCALTGLLCPLSLASASIQQQNGTQMTGREIGARPFWKWSWSLKSPKDGVDISTVARSLALEVRGAKDIFESISLLSEGGLVGRLEYVKWVISSNYSFPKVLALKGLNWEGHRQVAFPVR